MSYIILLYLDELYSLILINQKRWETYATQFGILIF